MAGARHGMCELALRKPLTSPLKNSSYLVNLEEVHKNMRVTKLHVAVGSQGFKSVFHNNSLSVTGNFDYNITRRFKTRFTKGIGCKIRK
jgi:hypothetical protein